MVKRVRYMKFIIIVLINGCFHNGPVICPRLVIMAQGRLYWPEATPRANTTFREPLRLNRGHIHCRQRAPVRIVLSSSGTSQLGMFDIQAPTKCKYYDHIVLLYLESRRCRCRSTIFACFYLYVSVVNLIDYSDIDKMMDINNEKC